MESSKLVTLATFETVPPADLALSILESAGIPCTLADDHLINLAYYYSHAIGGVRLQVLEEDVEAAFQLLVEGFEKTNPAQIPSKCPACESGPIEFVQVHKPTQIPLRFTNSLNLAGTEDHFYCRSCEARWVVEGGDADDDE